MNSPKKSSDHYKTSNAAEFAHVWSHPANERAGLPCVVLLHGYGSNAADLAGLIPQLPTNFSYLSVQAPHALGDFGNNAWSWYQVKTTPDGSPDYAGDYEESLAVTVALARFITEQTKDARRVGILGFFMGMIMVGNLLKINPDSFSCALGLSGFISEHEFNETAYAHNSAPSHISSVVTPKVPFFWGRDDHDPVINRSLIKASNQWLDAHTVLTKVLYTDIGHSISATELKHCSEFLTLHLT